MKEDNKQPGASTAEDMPTKSKDLMSTTSSEEAKTSSISEPAKELQSPSAGSATTEPPKSESLSKESKQSIICGNLDETTVASCQRILKIIYDGRKFSQAKDWRTLLEAAEEMMAFKAWVVSKKLLYEGLYRDKRAGFIRDGASAAAAEQEAKVSPEYRAYKYLENVFNLCEDQVLLVKKFKEDLAREWREPSIS